MVYKELIEFKRRLELSGDFLCELMQLNPKRFRRQRLPFKTGSKALPVEAREVELSPKALSLVAACDALFDRALEVHGQRDAALDWLYQDTRELGGKAPIDLVGEAGGLVTLQKMLGNASSAVKGAPPQSSPPASSPTERGAVPEAKAPPKVSSASPKREREPAKPALESAKKYRIDTCLKRLLADRPDLTKAAVARSMQELGFVKFDAARASRLSLGYADATGDEVQGLARIFKVEPKSFLGS